MWLTCSPMAPSARRRDAQHARGPAAGTVESTAGCDTIPAAVRHHWNARRLGGKDIAFQLSRASSPSAWGAPDTMCWAYPCDPGTRRRALGHPRRKIPNTGNIFIRPREEVDYFGLVGGLTPDHWDACHFGQSIWLQASWKCGLRAPHLASFIYAEKSAWISLN